MKSWRARAQPHLILARQDLNAGLTGEKKLVSAIS